MPLYSDINYINKNRGTTITDIDAVYQAVFTLLGTKVGQRVFRPTFGSYLDQYLHEPCDDDTAAKIQADISRTIAQEPRVEFMSNKSSVIPQPQNKAFAITICFKIIGFETTERTLELTLKQ
jgi:phage baseplate assembly protein W